MNTEKEFNRMMAAHKEIALATCVENIPNVRVVNFLFDEERKVLYFTSFEENDKVKEFELNSNVAFTTLPPEGNEHVRANGKVRISNERIRNLSGLFAEKIDGYDQVIQEAENFLILYEISIAKAKVVLDMENTDIIHF